MAKIRINDDFVIDGQCTVNRSLVQSGEEVRIITEGVLKTEKYIEEISQIDAPRFSIMGITVLQESFGSEENSIVYAFTAENLIVETDEDSIEMD